MSEKPKFDYFYDPADWEVTHAADDLDEVVQDNYDLDFYGPTVRFSTLIKGPDIFAYQHVTEAHWFDDEKTDPMIDDWEPRYADTKEEAEARHKASLNAALSKDTKG